MRTGNERPAVGQRLHGAHVIGLDHEFAIGRNALHGRALEAFQTAHGLGADVGNGQTILGV